MLNSAEYENFNAHKCKNIKKFSFLGSNKPSMLFFLLMDVKMPTINGILTVMGRKNLILRAVHELFFLTLGHVY